MNPTQIEQALCAIANSHKELLEIARRTADTQKKILEKLSSKPEISFPHILYAPEGSQTVDLRNLADVDPASEFTLIDFVAPEGGNTQITHFGIFNDGLLASDFDFFPRIDGRRIYTFHGDPLNQFRIYLGVAPDLGNDSLFQATVTMQPGQRLTWVAENRSAVVTSMGVRVVGYVDRVKREQYRWGG